MAIKIVFVIAPRTHLLDLAGPDQVFFESIFYKAPFQIEYVSFAPDEAGTASGLGFKTLKHYTDVEISKGDYVFIPGMDIDVITGSHKPAMKDLFNWLTAGYAKGVNICSVCTGAFMLASAGLLNHKICTTHWKYTQRLQQLFPQIQVQENVLFTQRDGIFTSAGIASGVDMALHIVELEMGTHFAHKVAREIVVYMRREGNHAQDSIFLQFRNHIHAGVHAAQDYVLEHLDKKHSLVELANLAHMSTRNFTRIFKKETGITIGGYITMLRREKIAELMKQPDLSRQQIARQVGLLSERQVNRLVK